MLITTLLLLLLLRCFSRVRLCATPQTAAHQAPLSLGFSRQEHWSGLPFPSPMHESEGEVAQLCPTLGHPMDCSPPGSSAHGICQTRVLEWGAIAFSISLFLGAIFYSRELCLAKCSTWYTQLSTEHSAPLAHNPIHSSLQTLCVLLLPGGLGCVWVHEDSIDCIKKSVPLIF